MRTTVHSFLKVATHRLVYYNLRLWQRVTVEGLEHLPADGPAMLVSNHPSYLDPPAIYVMTHGVRTVHFMAWDRLFDWPVVGWVCSNFDAFPVNLDRADRDSYRQASRLLAAGEVVGIFPEGQRAHADGFHPIKRGGVRLAIRHQVPIVPCAIIGTRHCWPVQRVRPRAGKIHIKISAPISPPRPAPGPQERLDQELDLLTRLHHEINHALLARGEIRQIPPLAWANGD